MSIGDMESWMAEYSEQGQYYAISAILADTRWSGLSTEDKFKLMMVFNYCFG